LESIGLDVLDIDSMLFTYFIRSSVKIWELIARRDCSSARKGWLNHPYGLSPGGVIIHDATRKQAKASLV
jgi:hypothetical protein